MNLPNYAGALLLVFLTSILLRLGSLSHEKPSTVHGTRFFHIVEIGIIRNLIVLQRILIITPKQKLNSPTSRGAILLFFINYLNQIPRVNLESILIRMQIIREIASFVGDEVKSSDVLNTALFDLVGDEGV